MRQSVLVASTLIDEYKVVYRRYLTAWRNDEDMDVHRADLERVYGGIWENLDTAATMTRGAGRSTGGYDELRREAGTGPAIASVTEKLLGSRRVSADKIEYTFKLAVDHNEKGLALARDAAAALRGAWPELDWTPPAPEPVVDLRPRGFFARLFGKK